MPKRPLPDLTDFLLEWKEKCAIDLCADSESKSFVLSSTDFLFCKLALQVTSPDVVKNAFRRGRSLVAKEPDSPIEPCEDDVPPDMQEEDSELRGSKEIDTPFAESPEAGPLRDFDSVCGELLEDQAVPGEAESTARAAAKPHGAAISIFRDVAEAISQRRSRTHAFHLLETFLYNKDKIEGKPFKNYLFEDAVENGSGVGALWGYLRTTIVRMVTKSFEKNIILNLPHGGIAGEGVAIDPFDAAEYSDPSSVDTARDGVARLVNTKCATDDLDSLLTERWPSFDLATKIALLGKVLEISLNDPEMIRMSGVGRMALYNRGTVAAELLGALSERGYVREDFLQLLRGPFQDLLLHFASLDPSCADFLDFFERNRRESGK